MRSKSIIITFDKTELPDTALDSLGLDWGLDGLDNQYKCYLHADGKFAVPETLLDLLPHALAVENNWQGSDYLDAYVEVADEPTDGLFLEHNERFFKNVRFSELMSGAVAVEAIIYKRKIYENGTD